MTTRNVVRFDEISGQVIERDRLVKNRETRIDIMEPPGRHKDRSRSLKTKKSNADLNESETRERQSDPPTSWKKKKSHPSDRSNSTQKKPRGPRPMPNEFKR